MKVVFILSVLFLTACTTPSTMLVNREGKVMRCASYGYGNVPAIAVAGQMHSRCVSDAQRIGFIPLPDVTTGINLDIKTDPLRVIEVSGPAQAAGVRVGDLLLEIDSQKVEGWFWLVKYLNSKKAGDRIEVKVRRQDSE